MSSAPAVAVGSVRKSAAQVFGQYFDDLVLTTFEDLQHDVGGRDLSFVGITAEPGSLDTVRWALEQSQSHPDLVVAIEIPDAAGLNRELRELVAPVADRVRGVEAYDGRPCLLVGGVPTAGGPDAWLGAVFETALAPTIRLRAGQEAVAREWEVAAARERAADFESRYAQHRLELDKARGVIKELEERGRKKPAKAKPGGGGGRPAPAPAAPEPAPGRSPRRLLYAVSGVLGAQGRRGRLLTLGALAAAGLVPALVLAVLLGVTSGAEGVVLGLALGALIGLVALGVLLTAFAVRILGHARGEIDDSRRRIVDRVLGNGRRQQQLLEQRIAMVEVQYTDVLQAIEKIPTERPMSRVVADRELRRLGDRMQSTLELFDRVPATETVPPMSGWAAAPDLILLLVDTLVRRRPSLVVECGSGISTLYLALAARQHGLQTRIVALDHDRHFAAQTRALLARHGVADYAEVRNAPLARTSLPEHQVPWYDEAALSDLHDIGLLFVDGPPAKVGPQSRYPAVPLLRDRFAPECTIILDDCVRKDERALAEKWAEQLDDFSFELRPLIKGAAVLER